MKKIIITLLLLLGIGLESSAQKPAVWIYTDMSDRNIPGPNKEGTVNDPDDISAMAAYLLLSNRFDTRGIVVTSTHRSQHKTSPNQAEWAQKYFGDAYASDLPKLNKNIGGYQQQMPFMQSCVKVTQERFDPQKSYNSLEGYPTVKALFDEAYNCDDTINVLCWGPLTEPAILVKHCIETNNHELLKRLRFIGHWTNSPLHQGTPENPEHVANCRDDAKACDYIKLTAKERLIDYYECGAIGQHGTVSGSLKGAQFYDKFKTSAIGKIFVEGKYVFNCVDFSDAATFIVLLGDWGVSLKDIKSDGTNSAEIELRNEKILHSSAPKLLNDLLSISIQTTK